MLPPSLSHIPLLVVPSRLQSVAHLPFEHKRMYHPLRKFHYIYQLPLVSMELRFSLKVLKSYARLLQDQVVPCSLTLAPLCG